ncbi:MAG: LemA family protein, partial [Bacteroidota bacterium]|nr:LemA family protein [Bacteroidota bacterium]
QLEGTENRIAVSRKDYNQAIKAYNSHIRGFFTKMFLSSEEFPKKEPFKEAAGSEKAPEVKF